MPKDDQQHTGFVRTWIIATRPFALPASTMPVLFGTALALWQGATFQPLLFAMALVAIVCIHSGSNLLNDIGDFKKGVDKQPTPVSGAVVRGLISTREAFWAAAMFLTVGSILGLALVALVGLPILYLGIVGVAIGVLYTLGPAPLKFHALGDLAVFLSFGILGALGAWTVQTGSLSIVPVVWAVPIGMLVAGILHANNWRDITTDADAKVTTVATLLGEKASMGYYGFLLFGAFACIPLLIGITRFLPLEPMMPWTFLLALLALPVAFRLMGRAKRRKSPKAPTDFAALDGATAQLNLVFGLLYVGALGLDVALSRLL